MKKSLIALAVAGVAASPLAVQAAAHGDGPNISGAVTLVYQLGDTVDTVHTDGATSLAVSVTDDLGNGLESFGSLRIDMNTSNEGLNSDAVTAGIRGGFGEVALGEVQNGIDYAQRANDIIDVSVAQESAIGYKNSFGDITLAVSSSPDGEEDGTTVGVQATFGMFTVAFGTEGLGDPSVDKSGFGASANLGEFGIDFHSIDMDDSGTAGAAGGPIEDVTAFRVRWASGPLSAAFTSASASGVAGADDRDATRIDVGYALSDATKIGIRSHSDDVDANEFNWFLLEIGF